MTLKCSECGEILRRKYSPAKKADILACSVHGEKYHWNNKEKKWEE